MPSLRDLLRRNNEPEPEEVVIRPSRMYSQMMEEEARLIPTHVYPSYLSTRPEPTVFNEREEYPEDTPEAIRIRLANLEDIERGLEEERRRNEIYYDNSFIPESPSRTMLRPNDQFSYGLNRVTFTTDRNMLVNEYLSHSRDNNYHAVVIDTEDVSYDGTPYTVRTIRYEPNPTSEMGGNVFAGNIAPPIRPFVIYNTPYIPVGGSTNMTGSNQSIYTDTDVGTVLPSTRYRVSAGVRT